MNPLAGAAEGLAKGIMSGLDDLFTSDEERAQAELKLRSLVMQPQILQAAANVQAAQHPNWWVAGARPALLWVCAAGLAYQLVLRPLLAFGLQVGAAFATADAGAQRLLDIAAQVPSLDMVTLGSLVTALLGLGGMRTLEKTKGVARG